MLGESSSPTVYEVTTRRAIKAMTSCGRRTGELGQQVSLSVRRVHKVAPPRLQDRVKHVFRLFHGTTARYNQVFHAIGSLVAYRLDLTDRQILRSLPIRFYFYLFGRERKATISANYSSRVILLHCWGEGKKVELLACLLQFLLLFQTVSENVQQKCLITYNDGYRRRFCNLWKIWKEANENFLQSTIRGRSKELFVKWS